MIIKREKAMIAIEDLKHLEARSTERQSALRLVNE